MPIEFKCKCGKRLRAPDGTEGRPTTCPACLKKQVVPSIQSPEGDRPATQRQGSPSGGGEGSPCPSCDKMVPANAVICVNCGFNVKTGSLTRMAKRVRRACPRIALPIKQVVAAAAVVAVLGAGWFCLAAPILTRLNISAATGYVVDGDLERALGGFERLRPNVGPEARKRVDLWIAQLTQEMAKNTGETLSKGHRVPSPALDLTVTPKRSSAGALLFNVKVTNFGVTPLRLSSDHFYLRGLSDIVLVANHTENSIDGIVVLPDRSAEGAITFRKVPDHAVMVQRGQQQETSYFLIYNDGEAYAKVALPF